MKSIELNIMEYGLLAKAILRKVFVQPEKGGLFFTKIDNSGKSGNKINIYMSERYFEELKQGLRRDLSRGKFASSNAEGYWLSIVDKFDYAKDIDSVDTSVLQEYEAYETGNSIWN